MNKHRGFTLIELLVALALGLVITAAATMLFMTGYRSYALQQSLSSLQDDANFGLNAIVKDIRLGNLNTGSSYLNERTLYGGVIFTSAENADVDAATSTTPEIFYSNLPPSIRGNFVKPIFLSQAHGDDVGAGNGWTGASNVVDFDSDQLVIQYKPQYIINDKGTSVETDDTWFGGYDCEGARLEFPKANGQQIIVQRYFLRKDDNTDTNEPHEPLALACDAGYYSATGTPIAITNFGDKGQILLKRVDHFRVLYGVQNGNAFQYMGAHEYMELTAPKPRILSVQLGVLSRSVQPTGNDQLFKDDQTFTLLDQSLTLDTPTAGSSKYVRQAVAQTVALRNAFGERGQ